MCVIAYKPQNINFPSDTILKNCFNNNPDGAGFMYAYKGAVHIQKGYETWEKFKAALDKARKLTGDNVPYVMHFRIATQGYEKTMTHPFPLSSSYKNLKKLKFDANIGIAHNGVLDLTSDGAKDYSDTMKFIADYLTLIIRNYNWYKDDRTKMLIERLIDGSRLAILDKHGHCELMGEGWVEDDNIFYSNESYKRTRESPVFTGWGNSWRNSYGGVYSDPAYDNYADPWDEFYDYASDTYKFKEDVCPMVMEDEDAYCYMCANACKCKYFQKAVNMD